MNLPRLPSAGEAGPRAAVAWARAQQRVGAQGKRADARARRLRAR